MFKRSYLINSKYYWGDGIVSQGQVTTTTLVSHNALNSYMVRYCGGCHQSPAKLQVLLADEYSDLILVWETTRPTAPIRCSRPDPSGGEWWGGHNLFLLTYIWEKMSLTLPIGHCVYCHSNVSSHILMFVDFQLVPSELDKRLSAFLLQFVIIYVYCI